MTARNAFLFPGQGSYLPGVFRDLVDRHPLVDATLATIDDVAAELGREPVSPMLLDADSPTLHDLVDHDPPALHLAIFAASVTAFRLLVEDCGVRPDILLGHSFGELVALTAAGALSLEDGAHLVGRRDESLRRSSAPPGGLVALNCGARRARHLLDALDEWNLAVAADNSPDQVAVSGPDTDLQRLEEVAEVLGINATRLRIPYPFHNRLMADAAEDFGARVADVPKRAPRLRVYSSLLGRYVEDIADVERVISGHLVLRVRFLDAVRAVHADGARRFVEAGPKGVLADLVAGIVPGVTTVAPFRKRTDTRSLRSDVEELASQQETGRQAPRPADAPVAPVRVSRRTTARDDVAPTPPRIPASRQRPEPRTPPVVNGDGDREAVLEVVRELYADLLGYPPDALESDADLEGDLGIDSIKQTEAFARASEHFDLPVAESKVRLTNYTTLDAIVDLLLKLREGRRPVGART
ncbi:acyltransferase domain-containing protein [Amycolatopsis sp. QT-25]|uniref:acyltransferase domain-containing protein n=1 Tax=Amycolatopsis sp. QT-25 TaxID=3034022 RepID=UPI0023EB2E16|nr:acyltransferase domain-containing protein [Amycolatopsis sp. QT-25]WET82463.1 acyltransferase domain-containing protein [Amycolatopsis sp. QT-25]